MPLTQSAAGALDALVADLTALGQALARGSIPDVLYAQVIDGLASLPPHAVTWADRNVANFAQLVTRVPPQTRLLSLVSPQRSALQMLKSWHGLSLLFLFHRDDYVREAALDR